MEKIKKACEDIFCGEDCLDKYRQLTEATPDLSERKFSVWMVEQHKSLLEKMTNELLNHQDIKRLAHNLHEKMRYAKNKVSENLTPAIQPLEPNLTETDKTTIIRSAKNIKRERREQRQQAREEQKQEIISKDPPLEGAKYKLIRGDFRTSDIESQSIDALICDPPYGFDYLPLYKDLSEYASRVLKPNAPCLVMIGQSWLEMSLKLLSSNLKYVWTLCYFSPGKSTQVFGRKIKSNWKPVVLLVNGENDGEHVGDFINSGEYDKRFHDWGQTEEGMSQLIERFTVKGDMILDPMCGAGTTGVASIRGERLFIGIDIDEYSIKQSGERLADASRGDLQHEG